MVKAKPDFPMTVEEIRRRLGGTGDVKLIILDPTQRNVTVSYSRMLASTSKTPAWAECCRCTNRPSADPQSLSLIAPVSLALNPAGHFVE